MKHFGAQIFAIAGIIALTGLCSCSTTKYVPQNEYLLQSYEIKIDNNNVKKESLAPYVRQKPNKRILGMRFHLWLYNRSDTGKHNGWNNWLRKNGEEPVIWRNSLSVRTCEQLKLSLQNQGYYYAQVTDTVLLKKKKAIVNYRVKTGRPYVVTSVGYAISDTTIAPLILSDTLQTLLKPGILLDAGILSQERKRIENHLRDNGYFSFSETNITYRVDTVNYTAHVTLNVRPHTEVASDGLQIEAPYPLYTIRSVTVNASMNAQDLDDSTANDAQTDTLHIRGIDYLMAPGFPVRAGTINRSLFVAPGDIYRLSDVNRSYQHLLGLRNFKQVSPRIEEVPGQSGQQRLLDCKINLLPFVRQSYTVELEGTLSDGNFGGGANFLYQNKSLFGHAEILDLRLRGMLEAISATDEMLKLKTAMEYEAEATIHIPRFLIPGNTRGFVRRYNPKTSFSLLYNYQLRPQYTRSVFRASMAYNWRGSNIISHSVRPLDVNYVRLENISAEYNAYLEKYPYLKNSYHTHMVVSGNYTFTRDQQQLRKDNFLFVRTNFETAGLLLNTLFNVVDRKNSTGYQHQILNNTFAQFVKADVDLRYFWTLNAKNQIVSRVFLGVGWPYGNSRTVSPDGSVTAAMPFEKKYYAGGATSMRGWRLRSLGPGSFKDSASIAAYPNNTGDIKIEVNLEYRFKLVWVIEGALFVDAGNVWDSHKDRQRPGADFDFKRFYREIALDAGFGLRFDFTYLLLSIDTGMKLIDPAGGRGWVFRSSEGNHMRNLNLSLGIGYPF